MPASPALPAPSPDSHSQVQTPVVRPREDGHGLIALPSAPGAGAGATAGLTLGSASAAPSTSAHRPRPNADLTTSPKNIILTEAGRAPWYDTLGIPRDAYVIGVAGGSASGKTSVARRILSSLPNVPWVCIVSQDSFYRPLTPEQSALAFRNEWNFDHPASFDVDLFKRCIADLKACRAVEIPVYSFVQHQRTEDKTYLYGASVVIVEGLFVLNDPKVRDLLDLKIFVQADSDLMLARRITRDTVERGRSVEGIIEHYLRWVKPAMDNYIAPDAKWADLIVPGQNNAVAVDVVAQHVKRQLDARALRFRSELGRTPMTAEGAATGGGLGSEGEAAGSSSDAPHHAQHRAAAAAAAHRRPAPVSRTSSYWNVYSHVHAHTHGSGSGSGNGNGNGSNEHDVHAAPKSASSSSSVDSTLSLSSSSAPSPPTRALPSNNLSPHPLPHSVHLLQPTPQLMGLLTIVHDATTSPEDFIFYTDRLSSLVVEEALRFLPYVDKVVLCKGTGAEWAGQALGVGASSASSTTTASPRPPSICSISILRSGSVLTKATRRALPALTQGSLLIQSTIDTNDGEPQLYALHLPACVRERAQAQDTHVLLLDSQISTGAAAFMAIRVLLDHGVAQERIVFVSLIASARGGIWALARAFPRVRIVLAAIDPGLKKLRVEYPRGVVGGGGGGGAKDEGQAAGDDLRGDAGGEGRQTGTAGTAQTTSATATASATNSKTIWAITPGCGSIGDRYYRTD